MKAPEPEATAAAARWLAKRDRGFSAEEFEEFSWWLKTDPRHAAAVARLEEAWRCLDRLEGKPELLTVATRPRSRPLRFAWVAAAAALVAAAALWGFRRGSPLRRPVPAAVLAVQRLDLPDGSVADLNRDSVIDVQFTTAQRRIRLLRGEARFTVARNPARPFDVTAGTVTVRALGTVFDVRMQPEAVEVLVTEGRVRVGAATLVGAGERAIVPVAPAAVPAVQSVSHEQAEDLLAWQDPRLVFAGQRLGEVAELFNRYNRHQLVVADDATAQIRIGGSFRASQVKAFVRLLELSFDVSAEETPEKIVLRRR